MPLSTPLGRERHFQQPTQPLARSGKWLSNGCGRRTRLCPSFTVSRSTSRASSRSPEGSSTRLSCAARKSSVQSAVRAKASKPNSGSSVAALSASSRCKMLRLAARQSRSRPRQWRCCRRLEIQSAIADERQDAVPAAAAPVRGSAVRAPGSALRDASPVLRAEAAPEAADWTAWRSAVPAFDRALGRVPRATFSAPRNRRANASRGTPMSAPIVFRPSRSSVRTVSGSRRRAET